MQLQLRTHGDDSRCYEFEIGATRRNIKIGSLASAEVHIPGIERLRALIRCKGGGATLIDMGGGMYVNGRQLHRASLCDGDVVALGSLIFDVALGVAADVRPCVRPKVAAVAAVAEQIATPAQSPAPEPVAKEVASFGRITSEHLARPAIESQPHPALPPERAMCQQFHALEMRLYWGETVLDLRHYVRPKAVTIGENKRADVFLSSEGLPAEVFPLIRTVGETTLLSFTDAMEGEIEMDGVVRPLRDWQLSHASRDSDLADTYSLPLSLDARVVLHWAGMTFALRFVPPPEPQKTSSLLAGLDLPYTNTLLLSALCHVVLLVAFAVYPYDAQAIEDDQLTSVIVVLNSPVGRLMNPPEAKPPEPRPERRVAKRRPDPRRSSDRLGPTRGLRRDTPSKRGLLAAAGAVRDKFRSFLAGDDHRVSLADPHGGLSREAVRFIRSADPRATLALGPSFRGSISGTPGGGHGDGLRTIGIGPIATGVRGGYVRGGMSLGRHRDDSPIKIDEIIKGDPLPRRIIEAVVKKNRGQVRYCYEKQLDREHDLEGRVLVRWVIGADGSVISVEIISTTMGNAAVEDCLRAHISTWRFPRPAGGGVVEVNYPFIFRAT